MLDAKWLEALKLPAKMMVGLALGATTTLIADHFHVLALNDIGPAARPSVAVVAILFWALTFTSMADAKIFEPRRTEARKSDLALRRAVRRDEAEKERNERRQRTLKQLDSLSAEELRYILEALSNDSPTFYTWVHSSPAAMLAHKGLTWTPGGTHNQNQWPFSFYDYVWDEIKRRKDEFIPKDKALNAPKGTHL